MSGFFLCFMRGHQEGKRSDTTMLAPAVRDELVRFPYDRFSQVASSGAEAAQAVRWYSQRDEAVVLPLRVGARGAGAVVAGDLRLDNADELRQELGTGSTATEPELVLQAFRAYGESFAAHLLGDFSLAIVDEVTRSLHLARDPLGVRPLYYVEQPDCVLVADDVAILAADPRVSRSPDKSVVAEWLGLGRVWNQRATFLTDVRKCPAGRSMIFGVQGHREVRHWKVSAVAPVDGRLLDTRPWAAEVAQIFLAAMRRCVDGPHLMGAHNSGGMDSAPISVIAARRLAELGGDLVTYNWVRPSREAAGTTHPEWTVAREIASREGILAHVEVGASTEELRAQLATHDVALLGTTTTMYELQVLRDAASRGVRQILSGFGGDELLTTRMRERQIAAVRRSRPLDAWRHHREEFTDHPRQHVRTVRAVLSTLRSALRPRPRSRAQQIELNREASLIRATAFAADWFSPLVSHITAAALEKTKGMVADDIHARQRAVLESGYLQERLETWAALGRRHGVRYLFPLLDREVVELAFRIPSSAFSRHGVSRGLWREALRLVGPGVDPGPGKASEQQRVAQLVEAMRVVLCEYALEATPVSTEFVDVKALDPALAGLRQGRSVPPQELMALWNAVLTFRFQSRYLTKKLA